MLIGILEAGRNRDGLRERHGSYPDMFERLLSRADPSLRFRTYVVVEDEFPASVAECDAWLVTGSKHTAFDRLPWMLRLEAFLREAMEAERPIVGICFGHQIMAQAMGGTVSRAAEGWGLGVHRYDIHSAPDWMEAPPTAICLSAVHQDQVTELPEGASVIASSDFCTAAIVNYGDKALTIQAHPEFDRSFVGDLVGEFEKDGQAPALIADARRHLSESEPNSDEVAGWIVAFLRQHQARRA